MHKKGKKRATPEITIDLHNSLFSRLLKSRIFDTHLAEVSPTDPLVLTRAIGSGEQRNRWSASGPARSVNP
jgi:hypothetical protein